MSCGRDRTPEFISAVQSLQSKNIQRVVNIQDPKKVKLMQTYGEFMMIASTVSQNIASTYTKLEKLTHLAKKTSLFDDRSQEIDELTFIIKSDLTSLNHQIARLQDVSKKQQKSSKGNNMQAHSSNVVVALQTKLADMSTNFKQALEVRTENLKQQKTRRDKFSQNTSLVTSMPPARAGTSTSLLVEDELAAQTESDPLLAKNQQLLLYNDSDTHLQQRAETMQNIESTVVELGAIFQQLAHMVKEQEEMVTRIDSNVMDVGMNVDMAHNELLKYFQSVTRNRALMIKIFGVLIAFFIFFVFMMS